MQLTSPWCFFFPFFSLQTLIHIILTGVCLICCHKLESNLATNLGKSKLVVGRLPESPMYLQAFKNDEICFLNSQLPLALFGNLK